MVGWHTDGVVPEILDRDSPLLCRFIPIGLLEVVLQTNILLGIITPGNVFQVLLNLCTTGIEL